MKDLKNLKGAKMLSKNEQRSIKGGDRCRKDSDCPQGDCPKPVECLQGFCNC